MPGSASARGKSAATIRYGTKWPFFEHAGGRASAASAIATERFVKNYAVMCPQRGGRPQRQAFLAGKSGGSVPLVDRVKKWTAVRNFDAVRGSATSVS